MTKNLALLAATLMLAGCASTAQLAGSADGDREVRHAAYKPAVRARLDQDRGAGEANPCRIGGVAAHKPAVAKLQGEPARGSVHDCEVAPTRTYKTAVRHLIEKDPDVEMTEGDVQVADKRDGKRAAE